jgi:glycosyltransferase involved in cell wall biosynthesis
MELNDPVPLQEANISIGEAHPPMVSVIIPCYNQASFLGEAIQSVLDQTYRQFEIIVIDDGSPDNIAEIIKGYPQVRLLKQANAGAAVARNNGMAHSCGDYLLFLDSDDRLMPGALETATGYLAQHPDMAFVTGHVQLIDKNGALLEIPGQPVVKEHHFQTLLRSNYIWTPGVVVYRRSVFQNEKGFDAGAGGSADYELNIRLARKYAVGCHGKVVLEYRQHGENMSSNYAYMLQSGVRVRRAQYNFVKGNRELRTAWRSGIRIVQDDVGEKLLLAMQGRPRTRKTSLWKELQCLWKYYPKGLIKFFMQRAKRLLHLL